MNNDIFERIKNFKTRYFFTWTGEQKTYCIMLTDGTTISNVTSEMLYDAAKALNADPTYIDDGIKRGHFLMFELYVTQVKPELLATLISPPQAQEA